jgi:hypothetical protein
MKKLTLIIVLNLLIGGAFAQVSFNIQSEKKGLKSFSSEIGATKVSGKALSKKERKKIERKEDRKLKKSIKDTIENIIENSTKKRKAIILSDTIAKKDSVIAHLNAEKDSLIEYQKQKIKTLKYWRKYDKAEDKENRSLNFMPVYFASQTKRFFEGDTTHKKFFANNAVNYSPISKKMVLYTEVINDYFGPLRLDIGFTLRSTGKIDTTKTADSAKAILKKDDLISALQNGGGDISFNAKFPLLDEVNDDNLLNLKVYSYLNVGFALPVVNQATDKFFANYDGGIEGFLFAKGFDNKITFFAQTKNAYYFGNRAFRKIINDVNPADPTSFFLGQGGLGLDFMDGFRFKIDFYYGNKFVKDNFPTTVTFLIRPGYKK